jgi:hypothetical protein
MKNNLSDLRNHLFDVIERLKDPDPAHPMNCNTAQAICLAAQRLIDSARVEIEFRKITDESYGSSDFLELPKIEGPKIEGPKKTRPPKLDPVMDD